MFTKVLTRVANIGAILAASMLVYMALATVAGVVLRYVFRMPNRFLFESTEFALALGIFLALGFVALYDKNVRVDLIPARFTRTISVTGIIARFGTGVIITALLWFSIQILGRDLATGIKMGSTFGLPRWILVAGLVFGLLVFAVAEFRAGWMMWRHPETYEKEMDVRNGGDTETGL